jgi:preprotein translocase subunit SecG
MKVRIHASGFGFTVQTCICRGEKKVILDRLRQRSGSNGTNDSHFRAFPKFSTSSRRNFSASAAYDALDRATSNLAVTVFSCCCMFLSWSRKDRIKANSLDEGALLSMAPEVLATVSYGTGQAVEIMDESCTRGLESHIVIGNQITSRHSIFQRRMTEHNKQFYSKEWPALKQQSSTWHHKSQLQARVRGIYHTMLSYQPC